MNDTHQSQNSSNTPDLSPATVSVPRQEYLAELMDRASLYLRRGGRRGQGRILRMLSRNGSLTQNEIQKRLDIQPSSVSELLAKLEASGFIDRQRDPADGRRFIISITQDGHNDLREHEIIRHKRQSILYDGLETHEQEELIRLLSKLLQHWDFLSSVDEQASALLNLNASKKEEPKL